MMVVVLGMGASGVWGQNPGGLPSSATTQTVCQGETQQYAVRKHVGSTYSWAIIVNPLVPIPLGSGSIASPTDSITNITWTTEGNCILRLIETNGSGCSDTSNLTIIITPINTVAAASSSPTLCINTLMTSITHTTTGANGIGTPVGLPAGVSAVFALNTITISGTPTESGTFNYSIPLTGGCGTLYATGTITVTSIMTAATPSSSPTLCINIALTPDITIATTGATGIGASTGLPAGVTAAWASNTITISGTPTASGTFNYSIPLTGGCEL